MWSDRFEQERWIFEHDTDHWKRVRRGELYHYTSKRSADSIMSARQLRLSNSRKLDDPEEYEIAVTFFGNCIRYYERGESSYGPLSALLRSVNRDTLDAFELALAETVRLKSRWRFYSFSLTELGFSRRHWREYRRGAAGACLVFDKAELGAISSGVFRDYSRKNPVSAGFDDGHLFKPVIYGGDEFGRKMFPHLDRAVNLIADCTKGELDALKEEIGRGLASLGVYFSSLSKSPNYAWEREWRLVRFEAIGEGGRGSGLDREQDRVFLDFEPHSWEKALLRTRVGLLANITHELGWAPKVGA